MGLRREQRDYWTKWNGEGKPVLDAARVALAMLQEVQPAARVQVASATFPGAKFKPAAGDDDLAELEELLASEGPATEIRIVVGETRDRDYGVFIGADGDGVSVTTSGPDTKGVKHFHGIVREMMRQTALGEDAQEADLPDEPKPSAPPGRVSLSETGVWIEVPREHVRIVPATPTEASSPAPEKQAGLLQRIEQHPVLVSGLVAIIVAVITIVFTR